MDVPRIQIERTYCDWIKKYVRFHSMRSRDERKNGEKKIKAFLTHLAVDKNIKLLRHTLKQKTILRQGS